MLSTETIQISPEILRLIARIDQFKAARRAPSSCLDGWEVAFVSGGLRSMAAAEFPA